MKKAILYVNQFFGQIGGEDKADFAPEIREGLVGPGLELAKKLDAEITHTIICGDNFMGSNTEKALSSIFKMLEDKEIDIFIAGPAFNAGRYGVACGTICKAVKEKYNISVLTSMNVENPGVEMFSSEMIIMKGGNSSAKMRSDIGAMAKIANKMLAGIEIESADVDGYFSRGIRKQVMAKNNQPAAERMMDMLLKKLSGQPFKTELPMKMAERVAIAPPLKSLKDAKIAIVSSGGIVPIDNPDRIQSASATRWGRYDISALDRFVAGEYKTIHAGYDPTAADADPNVVVPLDVLRAMEKEGLFGTLHSYFYSTVGTGTSQADATRMAQEIIPFLQEDNVEAVVLVTT